MIQSYRHGFDLLAYYIMAGYLSSFFSPYLKNKLYEACMPLFNMVDGEHQRHKSGLIGTFVLFFLILVMFIGDLLMLLMVFCLMLQSIIIAVAIKTFFVCVFHIKKVEVILGCIILPHLLARHIEVTGDSYD